MNDRLLSAAAVATAVLSIVVATVLGSGPVAAVAVGCGIGIAVLVAIDGATRGRLVLLAAAVLGVSLTSTGSTTDGPDLARGLLTAVPPLATAAAAVALRPRPDRLTTALLIGAVVAGPIRSLLDDPFLDAACAYCRHSAFAVAADRTAAVTVGSIGALLLAGGLAVSARSSSSPAGSSALVAIAIGLLPALRIDGAVLAAAALVVAAAATTGAVIRRGAARRRLLDLGRGLSGPDAASELLRRAAGDPDLLIVVDDLGDGPEIRSGGRAVARVRTSRADVVRPLVEHPSPPLLVALAGELLDRDLAARVRSLREARTAVVVRADEQRRRLERDLHDGAQQHVLAVGFDLRVAIATEQDADRRAALTACLADTMLALDELRDIAHGVYPPLLATAGLAPALRGLGVRTPAPIELGSMPGRMPQTVERLVYLLVDELARSASDVVRVDGEVDGNRLRLTARCSAAQPGALLLERIAALDGDLLHDMTGEEERWTLTVPCG